MELINIILFLISGRFNHKIEIMPIMYVIDGWMMIYLQHRVMMYNVEDCIHSSMGAQENNAYIIFDKQKNYVGSNYNFEQLFPEIVNFGIDCKIKNMPEFDKMYSWLDSFNKESKKELPKFKQLKGIKIVMPKWLEFNSDKLVGKINALPKRDDIDLNIQEHMIIELYSR